MSLISSELIVYGAANIAEVDTGTQGGAIDATVRYIFDDADGANDPTWDGGDGTLKVVSNNGADSMNVTVTGRDSGGSIVTEVLTLNGTTVVVGSQAFERILKVVLASAAAGSVILSDSQNGAAIGTTILTVEAGVTSVRRPFYNVSSDVAGGSARTFYEKVFIKNTNATFALLAAAFAETDPTTNVEFALEDAVNDTGTSSNRVTAPAAGEIGASGFSSAAKTLATETDAGTTDLAATAAIGVWLKLSLAAGAAATKSTYTITTSGSTA